MLRELRIHFCPTSASSQGVREFIIKNYLKIKTKNPNLPILIRESTGIQPRIFAQFEFGKEKKFPIENQKEAEIFDIVKNLMK